MVTSPLIRSLHKRISAINKNAHKKPLNTEAFHQNSVDRLLSNCTVPPNMLKDVHVRKLHSFRREFLSLQKKKVIN